MLPHITVAPPSPVVIVAAPVLLRGSEGALDLRLGDAVHAFIVKEQPVVVGLDEADVVAWDGIGPGGKRA